MMCLHDLPNRCMLEDAGKNAHFSFRYKQVNKTDSLQQAACLYIDMCSVCLSMCLFATVVLRFLAWKMRYQRKLISLGRSMYFMAVCLTGASVVAKIGAAWTFTLNVYFVGANSAKLLPFTRVVWRRRFDKFLSPTNVQ